MYERRKYRSIAAGKQAVLAGEETASARLFSSADRAYMKSRPPDLGPTWPDIVL